MANKTGGSKKRQSESKKIKRAACRERAKAKHALRGAEQLARQKQNELNAKDATLSKAERMTPWERACKKRSELPRRRQARNYWLRTNQIPALKGT